MRRHTNGQNSAGDIVWAYEELPRAEDSVAALQSTVGTGAHNLLDNTLKAAATDIPTPREGFHHTKTRGENSHLLVDIRIYSCNFRSGG